MTEVPVVHTLISDFGSLTVPEDVVSKLGEIGPPEPNWAEPDATVRRRMWEVREAWLRDPQNAADAARLRRWERTQCRLAGEAWAKGETHTITAEGLDDAQSQAA